MKCSYCQSENTQANIIRKDKKSRTTLAFVVPFLIVIVLVVIMGVIANMFWTSLFIGIVLAVPLGLVVSIIARIIPAKDSVVFICNDCGKITKK